MSMFNFGNANNQAAPSAPAVAPSGGFTGAPAQPVGGGGLFAGVAGAKRFGTGKEFMAPGTVWCVIDRAYKGQNQRKEINVNLDLTVIAVLDPAISEILPPETPLRVGKKVNWTKPMSFDPTKQGYFLSDMSNLALTLFGIDLATATPQQAEETLGNIFDKGFAERYVVEIKSYPKITRGTNARRVYQTFVRRVPWQEVAMLLDAQEQQQFFGGQLGQMCQWEATPKEQKGMGLVVSGWQPNAVGPGSAKQPAAIAAANWSPGAAAVAQQVQHAAQGQQTQAQGQPPQFSQPAWNAGR